MEPSEINREMYRLKLELDALQGKMRKVQTYIRGKETPGSGISTWGTRPSIRDAGRDERGDRSHVVDVSADELYLHDAKSTDQLAHELQHILIANQPAPTTGSDIVRSGTGHITVTPVEAQVNPAGHIDTAKTGAIASHGAPDQDGNETAIGSTNVANAGAENADPAASTVDGTKGLALTHVTRIALNPSESGGPNLYAFFRKEEADYKGHVEGVAGEVRQTVWKPPWGTAENQMWLWGGASTKYKTIGAPTSSSMILIYTGSSVGWIAPATLTVVTDYRINDITFQKKTRLIRAIDAGAATWVDVVAGTNCPSTA